LCESVEEMVSAIPALSRIDRRTCRRIMEERFSDKAFVNSFEQLYRRITRPTVNAAQESALTKSI
jgi:hypothetical protein